MRSSSVPPRPDSAFPRWFVDPRRCLAPWVILAAAGWPLLAVGQPSGTGFGWGASMMMPGIQLTNSAAGYQTRVAWRHRRATEVRARVQGKYKRNMSESRAIISIPPASQYGCNTPATRRPDGWPRLPGLDEFQQQTGHGLGSVRWPAAFRAWQCGLSLIAEAPVNSSTGNQN